ncbi:hypothetical protein B0W47_07835 [Komagataeibacter nataicola]|uniref:Uncharacterized protein n=1 Tax=Komagataeibacter nataicola TaxID=265960 RepID=A0A9N7CD99_9PROT|nr:hypothetical protein [Komagataeibacter nataicola]AQU87399.1 hypothetical protein B0W47_07835 [Komagataeibacter nataicola]PYD65266.1 hypothetical protein CDI09_14485 [Komagataeibacter nataicola]WNM09418.1 hypothetical protein RI056_05540 [Komagataeibacter nataicola]GBR18595.1 hypothetical protein AA0616_1333 [Komagataeibacter nataicola NRIC 0616]
MTCLPTVADFDAGAVPAWTLIRTMPAEARGVAHSLFDTLKANRMVVMRSGTHMLSDDEIAAFICETPATLARTLPLIEQWGFAARDDEGALYSPHLLQREIRRQERARKRAEREENLRRFEAAQAAGIIPADDTLKAQQARKNGMLGGRRRNGETKEEARARRLRAAEEVQRQRNIPLMVSLPSVQSGETENRNPNRNRFSVSPGSVSPVGSSVSLGIDIDLDNNPISAPTPDETDQTENPASASKAPVSQAVLTDTVERVMEIADFTEGKRQQYPAIRKWLSEGCPPHVLIGAVRAHKQVLTARPNHMGAFQGPIRAAWEQYQVQAPDPIPTPAMQDWEKRARADLVEDHRAWSALMQELGDYGRAKQQWADMAAKLGRPTTELTLEAYLAAYRPQDVAA